MVAAKLSAHVLARAHGELRGPPPAPHVEERDVDGKRLTVVVMPPTGGCGDVTGAYEFARAGDALYAVTRHVTNRRIDVVACGCPGCTCDPTPPPRCGGARIVADTILGYELPPGTHWVGEREVAYVEDWISVSRVLPPQPVCVAPPPPP